MDVVTHLNTDLTEAQANSILDLIHAEWPQPDWDREAAVQGLIARKEVQDDPSSYRQNVKRYVIWDGDCAVAQAETFARHIKWEAGTEKIVMALAGVVVDPKRRGSGLGKKIVQAALERVDSGELEVGLWQTNDAKPFYEALGARTIANRFANHRDRGGSNTSPWWNDHIMIYPANADWPHGPIDLNGPGY